jgi:pantoate kinase
VAQTPESKVKAKVKTILKELGAYYAMPIGTGYGNSGVPDFLICYKGVFIGIECKANGNKPTALQNAHIEAIKFAGGRAYVVDEVSVLSLKSVLQEV